MGHIIRWNARKGESFVRMLALQLPRDIEERIGTVYGLLSADAKNRKGEALAAHVEDVFVRGATEAVRKLPADATQDQLFEGAVARVNHALGRLFGDYGLDVEPERVHAALLGIRGHDVVAAVWNKPTILLFHPLQGRATRILDLVDESRAEKETSALRNPTNRRCFGSIIAGAMGRRDRILAATHDLRPFVGEDILEAIVVPNEPSAAADMVQERLSPLGEEVSVAVLVVDVAERRYVENRVARQEPVRTAPPIEPAPSRTPSRALGTIFAPIASALAKLQKQPAPEAPPAPVAAEPEPAIEKPTIAAPVVEKPLESVVAQQAAETATKVMNVVVPALKTGSVAAGKGLWTGLKLLGRFLLALANKEKRTKAVADLRTSVDTTIKTTIDRYNNLTPRSRALLYVALGLVMAANVGIAAAIWNRHIEGKIAAYERAVASVEQTIDSAEASMIYRDERRARELLDEASAATAALPEKKEDERTAKERLRLRIAAAHDTLRRIVPLGEPEILASITSTAGAPHITKLAAGDGVIWSVSDKGEIFKVMTADGTAEKVADMPDGAAPSMFVPMGRDLFAANDAGAGTLITLAGKRSDRPVDFADTDADVADAGIYNARLYVLDATHNRILRHAAGDKGFGKAQFYLKDGTDLSGGVSLAIDGAVYVLRRDGSVTRIVQGVREEFGVMKADPPVTAAKRLRTTAKSDFLYVLDGEPSRILKFNKKTGSFMAQYRSEAMAGATDMLIDEKAKTAIVAKDNQLLKFTLSE